MESTSKKVFCRNCGRHTTHEIFLPFHEKKERKFSKISQIIFCDECEETVLEVFVKFKNEDDTQSEPQRYPNVREHLEAKIQNVDGAIEQKIFLTYSNCVDSYNQEFYKASFLYLVLTIEMLCDSFYKELEDIEPEDENEIKREFPREFDSKLEFLMSEVAVNPAAQKLFTSIFSIVKNGYAKCAQIEFEPIIADIKSGIRLLYKFFNAHFNLNKIVKNEWKEFDYIVEEQKIGRR